MSRRFVTADTHFGHDNIIKYESRPFANSNHMTEEITKKWNGLVRAQDVVYHLGDVSFYPQNLTKMIVEKLNGRKILILGNHDTRSRNWYLSVGFDQVIPYPIILDKFWMLSHDPLYMNEAMPYVNIHGHLHSKQVMGANYVCVSLEQTAYSPVLFDDIVKRFLPDTGDTDIPVIPHGGT